MTTKRIIAIIGSIVLAVALVLGWSFWRKQVTAEQQQTQAQASKQNTQAKAQEKEEAATSAQAEENKQTALDFERKIREWGLDSTISASAYAKKPAAEALSELRTPRLDSSPIENMTSVKISENAGSHAASYPCLTKGLQSFCSAMPTAQDWLSNEIWGIGVRWSDQPTAKMIDEDTVKVTGTVRAVLVTSGDTYKMGGYSALTPAWKDYQVSDTLRIKDGKIASLQSNVDGYWWLNPWMKQWEPDNIADSIGSGDRVAIPVSGNLQWDGMNPTGSTCILKAPVTMADMDGKVNWDLWDGISPTGGSGSQQAHGLDPEKDAAAIQDRL